MSWRALACLVAVCLACWLECGRALAQSSARRVSVGGTVELALPATLREAAPPDARALPGRLDYFFTDGARQPVLLWVQSIPAQAPAALPLESALEPIAQGFAAGLSGGEAVRLGPYDVARGAFAFRFETSATGPSTIATSYAGVAFLTQGATVLALGAAPRERAADLAALAEQLWEQSRVSAAALPPAAPAAAFALGRLVGIVLGSLLGGFLLTWAISALLIQAKLARLLAVGIAGLLLVGTAALVLMLRGSPEALLQLVSYALVSGICYARLPRWLAARRGKSLLRDERGLSTVEYVVILVLLVVIALLTWKTFGESVRSKLAATDRQLSDTLSTSLETSARGSGTEFSSSNSIAPPPSGSRTTPPSSSGGSARALTGGSPGSVARPSATGAGNSLAAGTPNDTTSPGTTNTAPAPASSASSSSSANSAGAATAPPPSSPPGLLQQAKDYVRESAPVQTVLGIGYGTLQSIAPGGFLMPSPGPNAKAFETGRGIGQVATGITQMIVGGGMVSGGGAATVAGGAGALPSGGTSLVVSGAGLAVAAEGVVVAGVGASNVAAGVDTLTHAVNMSGTPASSGAPPPGPAATPAVPAKAQTVLGQVRGSGGNAPPGYKGGGSFANDGRGGGQVLPRTDAAGKPITYREYDVNRLQPGVNRGAERVVVGSDGKAYYTGDHYQTFTPIP